MIHLPSLIGEADETTGSKSYLVCAIDVKLPPARGHEFVDEKELMMKGKRDIITGGVDFDISTKEKQFDEIKFSEEETSDMFLRRAKKIAMWVAGVSLVAMSAYGAYRLYSWYKLRKMNHAYELFEDLMDFVDGTVDGESPFLTQRRFALNPEKFKNEEQKWRAVVEASKQALEKVGKSKSAGIFASYIALAEWNLGEKEKAVEDMKKAVLMFGERTILRKFAAIRLAMMQLYSGIEKEKKEGMEYLKNVANDFSHELNDLAMYLLGRYHWLRGEMREAKNYLKLLQTQYPGKGSSSLEGNVSPWVEMAAKMLETIDEESSEGKVSPTPNIFEMM